MSRRNGLVILLLGMAASRPAWGSDPQYPFVVVVNKTNRLDALSAAKLKIIFMGKISRWPWGAEIIAIDLPDSSPERRAFLRMILGSTPDRLAVYWIDQKVSLNLNPPSQASEVGAVKRLVATRPGAVAYIPSSAVDDTVKVIEVR